MSQRPRENPKTKTFPTLTVVPLQGRKFNTVSRTTVWPQDVFLEFTLSTATGKPYRTNLVKYGGETPRFSNQVVFPLETTFSWLLVRAFGQTPLRSTTIVGECRVEISKVVECGELDGWHKLRHPKSGHIAGDVYLELTYTAAERRAKKKDRKLSQRRNSPRKNEIVECTKQKERSEFPRTKESDMRPEYRHHESEDVRDSTTSLEKNLWKDPRNEHSPRSSEEITPGMSEVDTLCDVPRIVPPFQPDDIQRLYMRTSMEHLVLRTRLLELVAASEFRCLFTQAGHQYPSISPDHYTAEPNPKYLLPPIISAMYSRFVRNCPVLPKPCISAIDNFVRLHFPEMISKFQIATKIDLPLFFEYIATMVVHLKSEVWPTHMLLLSEDESECKLESHSLLTLRKAGCFRLRRQVNEKRPLKTISEFDATNDPEPQRIRNRRLAFVEAWRNFTTACAKCLNELSMNDAYGTKVFEVIASAATFDELPFVYRQWAETLLAAIARTLDFVFADFSYRTNVTKAYKGLPISIMLASLRVVNPSYFVSTVIRLFLWKPLGGWVGSHSLLQKLGLLICAYDRTTANLATAEKALNVAYRNDTGHKIVPMYKEVIKDYVKKVNPRHSKEKTEWVKELLEELASKGFKAPRPKESGALHEAVTVYAEYLFRKAEKEDFADLLGSEAMTKVAVEFFTCVPPFLNELYRAGNLADLASHVFEIMDEIIQCLSAYDTDPKVMSAVANNHTDPTDPSERIIASILTVLRKHVLVHMYSFFHDLANVSPRGQTFTLVDWVLRLLCKPTNTPGTKGALDILDQVCDLVNQVCQTEEREAMMLREVQQIMRYREKSVPQCYWKDGEMIRGPVLQNLVKKIVGEVYEGTESK